MPNQCTKCGKLYPDAAEELLKGCICGSKFFYYIKQEKYDELNELNNEDIISTLKHLANADQIQIEKDLREFTGMDEEPDKPVILDIESVRIIEPGKFEIDILNLLSKKRPLIYQLEKGKYIVDLNASIKVKREEIDKKIRDPKPILEEEKLRLKEEEEKREKDKTEKEIEKEEEEIEEYLDEELDEE